jgi:hypothetical protein
LSVAAAAFATLWLAIPAAEAQQGAAEPPGAAPAAASKCDAVCVRANSERAAQACARPIEAQAPIDFEWLTRPFAGLFQEAEPADDKTPVVRFRGDSIRFLNPKKEWVRVTYECAFDPEQKRVVSVRVRPGRLGLPPQAAAAGKPAAPKIESKALAAAIAAAVRRRQNPDPEPSPAPAKPVKTVKIGEPSSIEIQQVGPSQAH